MYLFIGDLKVMTGTQAVSMLREKLPATLLPDLARYDIDTALGLDLAQSLVGVVASAAASAGVDLSRGSLSSWGGMLARRVGGESSVWVELHRIASHVTLWMLTGKPGTSPSDYTTSF